MKLAYAAYPVDPTTLVMLRMGIALPFFLWLSRGVLTPSARDWRLLAGLAVTGFTGYYLSSVFDFIGLQYISVGLERLILLTCPTLVVVFESLWKRRPISPRMIAGMALTYIGIVIAFRHDLSIQGDAEAVSIGVGWVFLSGLAFSGYYVGSAMLVGVMGSKQLAGAASIVATVFISLQFMVTHPFAVIAALPPTVWGWATAMALISTALPIWFAAKAIEKMGAGRTAAIGSLGPALTVVFGWLVLGDPFSSSQLLGVTLVIGGVWWLGREKPGTYHARGIVAEESQPSSPKLLTRQ